jgi:hypothetical protein
MGEYGQRQKKDTQRQAVLDQGVQPFHRGMF